jgi:prepilin-type N-terminal cleavage/methylation domain-containing protein
MKKGVTLVELLIALAIFSLIIVAVGALGSNIFKYNSEISDSYETARTSQVILKTMLKELRESAPGANGAYPLALTGSTTLSFFSDTDNDGKTEKITYSLIGTTLYRASIKPTGTPATYLAQNQSTSTLVTNVINGNTLPSFQYYDTHYTGTSSPMVHPVNPSLVRLIKVSQQIDINPNRSPLPIIYTIQVSLRNTKTNL